jgi:signal transduction histidine kinase
MLFEIGTRTQMIASKEFGCDKSCCNHLSITHYRATVVTMPHCFEQIVGDGIQGYNRDISIERLVRSLRYAIERQQASKTLRLANESLLEEIKKSTDELLKAKEIDRFKTEFVSMLSHDFRNPLCTILVSAGMLQKEDERLTEEKKLTLLRLIRSAGKTMSQLLDEVSLINKADAGRLEPQLNPLILEDFCDRLIEELQISASEKKVDIVFITSRKAQVALWDEKFLIHILGNLLNNAIKYSPENSRVNFELTTQSDRVIFRIQDFGIGIPEENRAQLFQPFHRADNVGNIPGTGLGLAIVKRCLEACGGEISFDSKIEVGTTFIVTLPKFAAEV